jgi:hypothetical protein
MNVGSRVLPKFSPAVFAALLFASGAGAMAAPGSSTSVVVTSDPTAVSVTRVDGPSFYVKYTVKVTNNSSNNNLTYDFKGTTKVTTGNTVVNNTYAQFVGSTGVPCVVPNPATPTVVTCSKLSVDKNTSKTFTLTYKTPVSGDKLRLTVESTSNAIKGSGFAETTLITIPYDQTIVGFTTYVPPEGGTFHTGANGNWSGSPGAPAIPGDPWTTTIVIPPIGFSTTATVAEKQNGEVTGCSGTFYVSGGCFDTNLTIPSAPGAIQIMSVYLRVDRTKINLLGTSIDDAVIKYSKDGVTFSAVPDCSATVVPTSGQPCIQARTAYGSDVPTDWVYDWQFLIFAVDNGRYIN